MARARTRLGGHGGDEGVRQGIAARPPRRHALVSVRAARPGLVASLRRVVSAPMALVQLAAVLVALAAHGEYRRRMGLRHERAVERTRLQTRPSVVPLGSVPAQPRLNPQIPPLEGTLTAHVRARVRCFRTDDHAHHRQSLHSRTGRRELDVRSR